MDQIWIGLIVGGAITIGMIVIAFAWVLARDAWYWAAAKVMGWDHHEKFMRKTAWIEREVAKEQHQRERDIAADSGDRRRIGAYFVALVVTLLALQMGLSWWGIALAAITTYVGLLMVGGVTFKWSWS